MARLTVEDCLPFVENRFDLCLVASRRARQLAMGAQSLLDNDHDKPTVLALREIAAGLINTKIMDDIEAKERAAEEFEMKAEFGFDELSPEPPTPPSKVKY